ncbi:Inner membrane protein YjgN [Ensifer sp. M14]|nr:Inner membrane protein YjgN [Ensifer sp. M14]
MVVAETASMQGTLTQRVPDNFHRLSFTGSGKEYFGIWIVNVLLTIVTLGIYSAWAKVRRNRYFYGNTVLLGRAFEYHAKGKQILIGRIIVFAYLILYNVMLTFVPIAGIILALLLVAFVPWLVVRGLRFSARVTSYRNVRFDFVGGVGGAFLAFIVGPVISVLTLGILVPLASRWSYRYIGSNLRYGQRAFATDPSVGAIYKSWFLSAAIIVAGLLIIAFIGFLNLAVIVSLLDGSIESTLGMHVSMIALFVIGYIAFLSIFGVAALFYRAGVRNVAWSATTFDGKHQLTSDLSRGRYAWIAITNLIVTIVTLGLMRPWAAVRMTRYVNDHTGVHFEGNVGEMFDKIAQEGSAVGSEFMDFEGFDFGF